jgi:enoyl-CoA hydratase/3-hydroxyacyl-CoA dehydrogenase
MTIETVGVIGGGTMGSGLAQKAAMEGFAVVLLERTEEDVGKGMQRVRKSLDEALSRKVMTEADHGAACARITATTDYEKLSKADVVIEAVFEDLAVKKKVFQRLGQVCDWHTILATNTSSFLVEELAGATANPERVIGMHYFFHPAKNRLVEIVSHPQTHPDVQRIALSFNQALGKIPILCKDAYGFVVNRYYLPFVNESARLLEEGAASLEEIEKVAMDLYGIGMGPFAIMNATGIPVNFHASATLGKAFGKFYAPCDLLKKQLESGLKWIIGTLPQDVPAARREAVTKRLLGGTFLVAGELIHEGICSIEDCDLGARTGLAWKKGPFQLMNEVLPTQVQQWTEDVAKMFKRDVPPSLSPRWVKQKPWTFRSVTIDRDENIGRLILRRPDELNALSPQVLDEIEENFRNLDSDTGIDTIVIESIGKVFVAGADLKFFYTSIKNQDWLALDRFIDRGHEVFKRIEESKKLVIAKLHGSSFGGGTELALAADIVVASHDAKLSLPEVGLGIIPGFGGTQRLTLFSGMPIAKYLIYTGLAAAGEEARALGLIEYSCKLNELDELVLSVASNENRVRKTMRDAASYPATWTTMLLMLTRFPVARLLDGVDLTPDILADSVAQAVISEMKKKPRSALLAAEEAIEFGYQQRNLSAGYERERELIKKLAREPAALEGISRFASK